MSTTQIAKTTRKTAKRTQSLATQATKRAAKAKKAVTKSAQRGLDKASDALDAVADAAGSAFQSAKDSAQTAIDAVTDVATGAGSQAKKTAKSARSKATKVAKKAKSKATKTAKKATKAARSAQSKAAKTTKAVKSKAKKATKSAKSTAAKASRSVRSKATKAARSPTGKVAKTVASAAAKTVAVKAAKSAVTKVAKAKTAKKASSRRAPAKTTRAKPARASKSANDGPATGASGHLPNGAATPATGLMAVAQRLGSFVGSLFGRRPQATPVEDAISILEKDHKKVEALFSEFQQLGERALASRTAVYEQIRDELTIHATIEEELFYPAVRAMREKEPTRMVNEADEEHALIKQLLGELAQLGAEDATFSAKMKVLEDITLHHAKEEEKDMFPECKDGMSHEQRQHLGAQLATRKAELKAELGIAQPVGPAGDDASSILPDKITELLSPS